MVNLDKGLLKQIVLNLLSNAIKFSSDGTKIEVKTAQEGDKLILKVKDHGIGISKEDQKHLFERFFRGANAMNIQGTGLGLHIVARYAELMNGTVTYKSELEKGSEFIVVIKQPVLRK
jgi:signal transduction histidine kinase